ncbi:cupredoxin domain-containing protein [Paenibacillus mendelii]|uniref:Cupredoxin domain-containing protein n=1 Tax=Paenibacillus mendelii TaxID=206163 RepID=A0ABV6J8R6_9BACL|nr:cupredoxin domain-containing protein [Paenibacillus mendelii]MCQ6559619.1 cupredoxin domain-containing protein [Paenibacillus mendelii]
MMKKALFMCMLAAFVMVIAACGSNNKNNDKSPENAGNGVETTGSASSQEVVIKASSWKFDKQEYTIKKGEPVKLTLESVSGVHGIEVSDLDVKLGSGDSKVITINDAGEYEFHCNIQCGTGHKKMVAKLVVE